MPEDPGYLVVARIGRPHGLRGELTAEVRTDDPDERFAPGRRLLTDPEARGPLTVRTSAYHSGRWVLGFEGVDDRRAAEALRNTVLLVPAAELPALVDPEEFYDHQLVGLPARTTGGAEMGVVRDVVHGPAGDLLVLQREGRETLIPFIRQMVPTVDVSGGFIIVDPPEGLFEL